MASNTDLATLVQGPYTDAVISLERAVATQADGTLDDEFTDLSRKTVAAWVAAFGSLEASAMDVEALRRILAAVRRAVRRLLGPLAPRAQTALDGALADAVTLGAKQHSGFVHEAAGLRTSVIARPSRALRALPGKLADMVGRRRDAALQLLQPASVDRWSDILTGIGTARGALSSVRSHIAWVINQGVNEGLLAGIKAIGANKLWIAEADACLNCAAYTGLTAPVGEPFPAGLSFDPQQRGRVPAVDMPPQHPNCRCRCVAWKTTWATSPTPFPEWLQREARSRITRSQPIPGASRAATIRAARALRQPAPA
jgi:hypothetical protein